MRLLWLTLTVLSLESCSGANILALMTFPSKSHAILQESLLKELSARGHSITFLTAMVPAEPIRNVTIVQVPNFTKDLLNMKESSNMNEIMRDMTAWGYLTFLPETGLLISERILNSDGVKKILDSNEAFDLVIADFFLEESVIAGFAYKYKAPIVAVHPFLPSLWPNYMVGNPAPSSFIPDPFLAFDTKMTFYERAVNFIYGLAFEFYHVNVYLQQQDALMKKTFGAESPPIHDILKNTSLVLVNHHFALAYPRPYVPNMIEVGGMHIGEPKPLPTDLQKYMDNSKHGVILFSLGTNVKSADLPPEKIHDILKAFSRLKQNVLWKFEEELQGLPMNVRTMKWVPQSDILAHRNLKLLVTHGGHLSITESIHRGVPVVGIPFFCDQFQNMRQIENAGFGKTLNFDDINENTLFDYVTDVISNPRYSQRAIEKSNLFKDNPLKPLDRAIWWIEYVIRHKGAKHLRSAAQDLNWFQLHLIDVYVFISAVILGVVLILMYMIRFLLSVINTSKKSLASATNKKKQ